MRLGGVLWVEGKDGVLLVEGFPREEEGVVRERSC